MERVKFFNLSHIAPEYKDTFMEIVNSIDKNVKYDGRICVTHNNKIKPATGLSHSITNIEILDNCIYGDIVYEDSPSGQLAKLMLNKGYVRVILGATTDDETLINSIDLIIIE